MKKVFVSLHILGAFLFFGLAFIFFYPATSLPKPIAQTQQETQKTLAHQAASWLESDEKVSEDTLRLKAQMLKEQYEDEIRILKEKRSRLESELRKKEKSS